MVEKRIELNAFAPIAIGVSNHIHLIWQPLGEYTPEKIQHSLMSFTAHKFKNDLQQNHTQVLPHFKVLAKDRDYPRLNGRAGVLGKKFVRY